jgi:hypothetical protein
LCIRFAQYAQNAPSPSGTKIQVKQMLCGHPQWGAFGGKK